MEIIEQQSETGKVIPYVILGGVQFFFLLSSKKRSVVESVRLRSVDDKRDETGIVIELKVGFPESTWINIPSFSGYSDDLQGLAEQLSVVRQIAESSQEIAEKLITLGKDIYLM